MKTVNDNLKTTQRTDDDTTTTTTTTRHELDEGPLHLEDGEGDVARAPYTLLGLEGFQGQL